MEPINPDDYINRCVVYLLHFSEPYKGFSHYIGYSEQLPQRLFHHRKGSGAKLLTACKESGITFTLVRVWINRDRSFERMLKNRHNHKLLCPVCNPLANRLANYETLPKETTALYPGKSLSTKESEATNQATTTRNLSAKEVFRKKTRNRKRTNNLVNATAEFPQLTE